MKGYGGLCWRGRTIRVHRAAWEVVNGPVPAGLIVCHRCDNRKCLNVDHLFLGTEADNAADRDAKGRQARGQSLKAAFARAPRRRVWSEKLTPEKVLEIRAATGTHKHVAGLYGVSPETVRGVRSRRVWAHV